MLDYFGSGEKTHPFQLPGKHWLSLHEPQVTRAFANFLNQGDCQLVLAFLRALVPEKNWPTNLKNVAVRAEEPTKMGRIDILLKATAEGKPVGVVIEAKFGHHAKGNPFADYRTFALNKFFDNDEEHVEFIILGNAPCKSVQKVIAGRRSPWKFVTWADFLRRFDKEIFRLRQSQSYARPYDYNFTQLRRSIWEMI